MKEIHESNCMEMIIIGDFNLVMDPSIDRTENVQYAPKARVVLDSLIEDFSLIDIWRVKKP